MNSSNNIMILCKYIHLKLYPMLLDGPAISQNIKLYRNYSRFRTNPARVSKILQPMNLVPYNQSKIKENSDNHEMSKSSRLLIDNGFVRSAFPGNYVFLPLGMRVLQKIIKLVDNCMQSIDGQKMLLPTLTEGKLWQKTGRYDKMKEELLITYDRHKKLLILR